MVRRAGLRVARALGIPIYLHPSWFIIFFLITFSLSTQFRQQHPQWSHLQHWSLGILTSLLFFGSVVFHELAHSVVAIRYRIPVLSITLFVFGGVARIGRDPDKAIQEFNIAIAGPLSSYFLSGMFWLLFALFPQLEMLRALSFWLAWVNFGLATFNLLPGFPLDGGRIFRALAWRITGSYERATRLAGRSGRFMAYAMIVFGAWRAMAADLVGGLWIAFLGWFLMNAAQETVIQATIRTALAGLRASDVMSHEVPEVAAAMPLDEYGRLALRTGHRCHFVLDGSRLLGLMNIRALNGVPREAWHHTTVQTAMVPRERIVWTSPDHPLLPLLERMVSDDINQVPVVQNGDSQPEMVGVISRDSILRVIQSHLELQSKVLDHAARR